MSPIRAYLVDMQYSKRCTRTGNIQFLFSTSRLLSLTFLRACLGPLQAQWLVDGDYSMRNRQCIPLTTNQSCDTEFQAVGLHTNILCQEQRPAVLGTLQGLFECHFKLYWTIRGSPCFGTSCPARAQLAW